VVIHDLVKKRRNTKYEDLSDEYKKRAFSMFQMLLKKKITTTQELEGFKMLRNTPFG
jgi:hypothetical protein